MKIKHYILLLIVVAMASCKPDIEEFKAEKGNADFTSYIALGNSLTAGYADGALYRSSQENSYPSILARQFRTVGGGDFTQPLTKDDYGLGFDGTTPVPKLILGSKKDCQNNISMAPVRAPVGVNLGNLASIAADGPFNNIGVPGAKSYHLFVENYAALNPYYGRFAPSQTTPVISLTAAIDATFFTLWIGNNDILGYALSGGSADPMTEPALYGGYLETIIQACIQNQDGAYAPAKGAVANIPDITSIPYFNFMNTRIPYNGLVLTAEQAIGLTQLYALYGHPEITFSEGPNAWVVEKSDGSWGRMEAGDLVILSIPTDSMLCSGMGAANQSTNPPTPFPIPHKYILDKAEAAAVQSYTEQYNEIIFELCSKYGLAYVDTKSLLDKGKEGFVEDGIEISTEFISGNFLSLDGIHLTPMGSAGIANLFIDAINSTYGSSIPKVNLSDYSAVYFP